MAASGTWLLWTVLIVGLHSFASERRLRQFQCSGSGEGECEYNANGWVLVCTNVSTPNVLKEAIMDLLARQEEPNEIIIRESSMSHLPLLDNVDLEIDSIIFEDSFVAFLAPPMYDESKGDPFLKGIEASTLIFRSVPYVHAFNWENVFTNIIEVTNSRFVAIPQSLNSIEDLEVFTVTKSELRWIHKDAFNGLENLGSIDLSYNHIEKIEDGTFSNLYLLGTLTLNNNKIMWLSETAFIKHPDGSSLDLYLDGNPLKHMDFKVFGKWTLHTLSLEDTNLLCTCDGIKEIPGLNLFGNCFKEDNVTSISWKDKLYECCGDGTC